MRFRFVLSCGIINGLHNRLYNVIPPITEHPVRAGINRGFASRSSNVRCNRCISRRRNMPSVKGNRVACTSQSDSNPEEESQSETPQVVDVSASVSANRVLAKLFSRALRNRAFPCCCIVRRAAPI